MIKMVKALLLTLLFVAILAPSGWGASDQYPRRPIQMIVCFGAGGGTDLSGRALVEAGKPFIAQPIAVVNRVGAAGTVGAFEVMQAKPDGYTVGWAPSGVLTNQPHLTDVPFKQPPDDYQPVIATAEMALVMAVKADSPRKNLRELVDYAKANPRKLRWGHPGIGTLDHIAMEAIKLQTGIEVTMTPFGGDAEVITALLGGHIDAGAFNPQSGMALFQAGMIRPIVVQGDSRNPIFPDVPSAKEMGFESKVKGPYLILYGPKGMPKEIVQYLHDNFKKAMETDAFQKILKTNGFTQLYLGTEALTERLRQDYVVLGNIIKQAGIGK